MSSLISVTGRKIDTKDYTLAMGFIHSFIELYFGLGLTYKDETQLLPKGAQGDFLDVKGALISQKSDLF